MSLTYFLYDNFLFYVRSASFGEFEKYGGAAPWLNCGAASPRFRSRIARSDTGTQAAKQRRKRGCYACVWTKHFQQNTFIRVIVTNIVHFFLEQARIQSSTR